MGKFFPHTIFDRYVNHVDSIHREEDSESLANVKNALADASQTAYVRGQWVYADTGHNGRYCIAGAYLPGTGDMAAYQLCGNYSCKSSRHLGLVLNDFSILS